MGRTSHEEIPNCWEVNECPDSVRDGCRAYPNSGRQCWKVTGTLCNGGLIEKDTYAEKILYCRNSCKYYRKYIKPLYP